MIKSLQFVRFIFALLIFYHHFYGIMVFGLCSVTFFFILSGFLLSWGYGGKVLGSNFSFKQFIFKRLAKLYPAYIKSFLIAVGFLIVGHPNDLYEITKPVYWILDVLMLQSWIPVEQVIFSGNSVSWFVSVIIFFYLSFPILYRFIYRQSSIRKVATLLLILLIYFLTISLVPKDFQHQLIYANPIFRIVDFIIGIYLYSLCHILIKYDFSDISKKGWTIMELIPLLIIAGVLYWGDINHPIFTASIYWLPISFLILTLVVSGQNRGGYLSMLFEHPFLQRLGSISFEFYLLHAIIFGKMLIVADLLDIYGKSITWSIICIIIIVVSAYVLNWFCMHKIYKLFT